MRPSNAGQGGGGHDIQDGGVHDALDGDAVDGHEGQDGDGQDASWPRGQSPGPFLSVVQVLTVLYEHPT